VLPRRSFSAFMGRMLHDRTADKIAAAVSRIPNAAATIIPFDVESRVRVLEERHAARAVKADGTTDVDTTREQPAADGRRSVTSAPAEGPLEGAGHHPAPGPPGAGGAPDGARGANASPETEGVRGANVASGADESRGPDVPSGAGEARGADAAAPADGQSTGAADGQAASATDARPIGSLHGPEKVTVEGRVISLSIRPVEQNSVLAVEVADETGTLTALFYGRKHIPGLECGSRIRLQGSVGIRNGRPVMINPIYELLG
jgi:hypothetical protein